MARHLLQEDQGMEGSEDDKGQPNSEVVDLKNLGSREGEDRNSKKLGDSDTRKDRSADIDKSSPSSGITTTESITVALHHQLNRDTDANDEVDKGNGVQRDTEQGHATHDVYNTHHNSDGHHKSGWLAISEAGLATFHTALLKYGIQPQEEVVDPARSWRRDIGTIWDGNALVQAKFNLCNLDLLSKKARRICVLDKDLQQALLSHVRAAAGTLSKPISSAEVDSCLSDLPPGPQFTTMVFNPHLVKSKDRDKHGHLKHCVNQNGTSGIGGKVPDCWHTDSCAKSKSDGLRQTKTALFGLFLNLEHSVAKRILPVDGPCDSIGALLGIVNNPCHSYGLSVHDIIIITAKDHIRLEGLTKVRSTIHGAFGACTELLFPGLSVKPTLRVPVGRDRLDNASVVGRFETKIVEVFAIDRAFELLDTLFNFDPPLQCIVTEHRSRTRWVGIVSKKDLFGAVEWPKIVVEAGRLLLEIEAEETNAQDSDEEYAESNTPARETRCHMTEFVKGPVTSVVDPISLSRTLAHSLCVDWAALVFVIAGMEVVVTVFGWEVDLEGRADEGFLVSKELEHLGIVLSTTTNQIHGFAVCAAKLDLLTTVVETGTVFLRNKLVKLCDELLAVLFGGVGHIDEERLVGGARESTKQVEEITADRSGPPLLATKLDEFISKLLVGILSQTVIDAWKVFSKEALLATMAAESASSGFVFRCVLLGET
ncbi:hypothetical protein HG530_009794 [Fusarium avenaceum]|nr:hypothetical protein HG530_009794 [Fusarium avenaceum]